VIRLDLIQPATVTDENCQYKRVITNLDLSLVQPQRAQILHDYLLACFWPLMSSCS
jgi:hypothetical protein